MANEGLLRFLTGALSGGVQGYQRRRENVRQDELMEMQRESQELERERVSAAIAAANQQLKASQFGLQQEQELAAHLKTPFRQVAGEVVGGLPAPGDVGPYQEPGVREMGEYVQGLGPAAGLPMGMIPQAAGLEQLQMGGLQQQALQQQMADLTAQRDIEAGQRAQFTSPMGDVVSSLLGADIAGLSPQELEQVTPILSVLQRGAGAGAGDQWSYENALRLLDLKQKAQEDAFLDGFGLQLQKDPDLFDAYNEAVTMNFGRPLNMQQIQGMLTPEALREVNEFAAGRAQESWLSAVSGGGLGAAPGGVPGGQPLPTGGLMPPPMGGSPGPGLPLPAAADSVLTRDLSAVSPTQQRRETGRGLIEQHPGIANITDMDRVLPGSGGQTVFDYIASRIQTMRGVSKYKGKSDDELLQVIFEELAASEVLS